jgi:hypothetical protein
MGFANWAKALAMFVNLPRAEARAIDEFQFILAEFFHFFHNGLPVLIVVLMHR